MVVDDALTLVKIGARRVWEDFAVGGRMRMAGMTTGDEMDEMDRG